MNTIKVNEYVCDEIINRLKESLNNDLIDIDIFKDHINNCPECLLKIRKLKTFLLTNISPISILNLLK